MAQWLSDGGYWDGAGWCVCWTWAKQYLPAPADGHTRASEERDRQQAAGHSSVVLYIPLRERKTSSKRPRPNE